MVLSSPVINLSNPRIPVAPQAHPIIPPLPSYAFVNEDLRLTSYSLQFLQQLYAAVTGITSGESLTDTFDTLFGGEPGSVIFRGESSWEGLAPGTAGYVLTTHGPNVDPTWAPGGGTGTGTGTITGVVAGVGLVGGGLIGTVTLSLTVPVSIAHGGTGATTALSALTNLGAAPVFSPVFTGDPRAPTPLVGDNDNSIATTAFVTQALAAGAGARIITDDTPPSSPVDGDAWWDSKSGQLYIFYDDGSSEQWVPASNQQGSAGPAGPAGPPGIAGPPGPPGRFFVGPSPPSSPVVGDGWWDSDTGQLYIWYNDGTSAQWVAASNQPGPPGPPGTVAVTTSDVAPLTPSIGDLWWDTVSGQLYIWYDDGSSEQWVLANNIPGPAGSAGAGFPVGSDGDELIYNSTSSLWEARRPLYFISYFVPNTMAANQTLIVHRFSKAVTLPLNFGTYLGHTSQALSGAAVTGSTVVTIQSAPSATPSVFTNFGTITFAAGSQDGVFSSTVATLSAGDVLRLRAPATPDTTFSDFAVTIVGFET